jgi:hypothetical protein
MATQGMVTVRKNRRVVLKIVAGCDGWNAVDVARAIRRLKTIPSMTQALALAQNHGLGCQKCLLVITATQTLTQCEEEPNPLLRSTFNRSRFNPRWERGTADYIKIVDF